MDRARRITLKVDFMIKPDLVQVRKTIIDVLVHRNQTKITTDKIDFLLFVAQKRKKMQVESERESLI